MGSEKNSHSVNIVCSETVRYSFASHLSGALRRQGVAVSVCTDTDDSELETYSFPDDQNQGARVSVVVFTETYTSSVPWFNKHLEHNKNNGYVIVPVFYGVDPSVVNRDLECLRTVTRDDSITGHQSSDSEVVEEILKDVYGKLYPTERVGTYSRLLEIENQLCEQPWDIRSLGIWGMPGIGKTILAKALFDQIRSAYHASCFIENFDEALYMAGPQRLLEEQIFKIVMEKFGVSSTYITRLSLQRDKLCDSRILLVLDDVCDPLVAQSFLARLDWFGPGSLIIITSRFRKVFALCQVNQLYRVQGLNEQEALQLFSHTVFENDVPEQNDWELSMKVIDYANGNPLALRVYGQELKGNKSEMEATFLDLKQSPPQKIQDGLRGVYSVLGDNEKHIFLDISCFFKGEDVDYVAQLLKGCGYCPRAGIDILVERCLVNISENILQMNDLIQDIFREIIVVDRIQMKKCTTMWQSSSIRYLLEDDEFKEGDDQPEETPKCVLVAEDIKGICLDASNVIFNVKPDAFKTMASLRFLKIYNSQSENILGLKFPKGLSSLPSNLRFLHWEEYPLESLPQGFDLRELVELSMPNSQLKKLRARTKNLEMLKRIRLCNSQQLLEFSIHEYAQNIEKIDLQGCTSLESFPAMTKLEHLRVLSLSGCSNIKIVPGLPPNIEELYLQGTSIEELPKSVITGCSQPNCEELMNHMRSFRGFRHIDMESVANLIKTSSYNQGFCKLVRLNMKDCLHLRSLLDMFSLESLQVLDLSGCSSLKEIKGFPRRVKELYLAGTCMRELPEFPESLEVLNAHECYLLESVRLDFKQLPRHYTFSNCLSLSLETTAEFLEKGLIGVIRLAKEENQEYIEATRFIICFAADVCPSTSSHMRAGSFVTVEGTPCTQKALTGFAMSVLVAFQDDCHNVVGLGIRCICTWGTKKGHFCRIERVFKCWAPTEAPRVEKDHLFVFYDSEIQPGAGEIKFEFHTVSEENKLLGAATCMVIECGVQVITAPIGDNFVSGITRESEAASIIKDNSDVLPSPIPWRSQTSSTKIDTKTSINNLMSSSSSSPRKLTPLPNLTSPSPEAKITDLESQVSDTTTREKLEEEIKKRDALIERLHEENEKLFDRLTEISMAASTQVSSPSSRISPNIQPASVHRYNRAEAVALPSTENKNEGAITVVKSSTELVKTTPSGEYLTTALNDFDPEDYEGLAAIADGANKLLMLVLAAVIKAGASKDHEILAEIRGSVFSFIQKMESRRVMDTMLVSRVRILYISSLLARSPEIQTIRVSPVEGFLEKPNTTGRSKSTSRGSSPGRFPVRYLDMQTHRFKVNIKPERKNKLASMVSRMRGLEQDSGRQQVTGVKLREMQNEAKSFAIGNKALAALFVHTPAGELQQQIRLWLAENFDFLSVTADDVSGGTTGQLELLSTAIMDGWMAGLGAAVPPHTDALGQLLSEYAKRVYTSQMQHMKDIAGTLAAEEAEDAGQVAKLRSALESVDHKRRKILQQMRSDAALLNLEEGSSPIQNPSTAAEDSRLASLISLDGILKQVKDITRQASVHVLSKSKKTALLEALDDLSERMPSLLDIDHPCAQREIATARQLVETIPEQENNNLLLEYSSHGRRPSFESISSGETEVSQWNVLQFNTGSSAPFIIKCGGNANSELVIKADARVQEPKGGELVRVVPRPSVLVNMSLEEMKQMFTQLPEALSVLALAKTADATRARYSRLYKTLAMKVPSLRDVVTDLEKDS